MMQESLLSFSDDSSIESRNISIENKSKFHGCWFVKFIKSLFGIIDSTNDYSE